MDIRVAAGVYIDEAACRFSAAHSSGPGGQHVNTSNSKVILEYPLDAIKGLQAGQRQRLYDKLGNRITAAGMLRVVSQRGRSQWRNRRDAFQKLQDLLAGALKEPKKRKATRVPSAQKQSRLMHKKKRAQIKKTRSKNIGRDD